MPRREAFGHGVVTRDRAYSCDSVTSVPACPPLLKVATFPTYGKVIRINYFAIYLYILLYIFLYTSYPPRITNFRDTIPPLYLFFEQDWSTKGIVGKN